MSSSANENKPWWQEWFDKLVCVDAGLPEPSPTHQHSDRAVEGGQNEWASAASAAAKVEAARTAAQGAWAFARAAAMDAEKALTEAQKAVETAKDRRDSAMRKDRKSMEAADKAHWALAAMGYQIGDYSTHSEAHSETEEILLRVKERRSFSICHASEEVERIKTAADGRMDIVKTTRTGTVMSAIIENANARCEEVEALKQQLEMATQEKQKLQLLLKEKDRTLKSSDNSLVEENEELMAEVGRLRIALLEEKKAHRSASSSPMKPLSQYSSPKSQPPADMS